MFELFYEIIHVLLNFILLIYLLLLSIFYQVNIKNEQFAAVFSIADYEFDLLRIHQLYLAFIIYLILLILFMDIFLYLLLVYQLASMLNFSFISSIIHLLLVR